MMIERALMILAPLTAAVGITVLPVSGQNMFGTAAAVVGELEAPETHVFGRIRALALGEQGELFVLDAMNRELRWFDASGAFVSRTGRSGRGPGELFAPTAVTVDGGGSVYVLDPPNLKIARYRATADGLEHLGDMRIGPAFDFCMIGARQFTMYPSRDGVVHELDATGAIRHSFGDLSVSDVSDVLAAEVGLEMANRGDLACDRARGRILRTSEQLGRVYSYDLSGHLLWETRLPEFHPVRWERVGAGRIRMAVDPSSGTAQTVSAIAVMSNGDVLVTVHEGSASNPDGQLVARILDGSTGRQVAAVPSAAVWVLSRGKDLFGIQELPFPRVVRTTSR
jgi:hypothetical protein